MSLKNRYNFLNTLI